MSNSNIARRSRFKTHKKLLAAAISIASSVAWAQAGADSDQPPLEELVIVGSQIKGADVEGVLPVTVMTPDDIAVSGAVSGDDLLRSIPQMGTVGFNESKTTGVNAARGDVSSVNLRGLGTGNTLVLINGRRMVLHPGTQTENFIPVVTGNSNTIPVQGVERVEVLRDGAAALYGTDAVAGVINYALKKDYEGGELNVRYGSSLGTELDELTVSGAKGFEFNNGRTHLTLSGLAYNKNGMDADERSYSKNSDLRGEFEGDPLFEGDTSLDNRSSGSGWGEYQYDGIGRVFLRPTDLVRDNGSTLGVSDCWNGTTLNNSDICLDPGSADRALRGNRNESRQLSPDSNRYNFFSFLTHELENDVELYSELGYYKAKVEREREVASLLSNSRFDVPADYYWNPLGPVTFADGRVNPNRIVPAGHADVPDEGLGFTLRGFAPYDVGPRKITVDDTSYRFVFGGRGEWNGWDWDSGVVYSEAKTTDSTSNRVSHSLLQQSLSLDTADAYNLFSGVNINDVTSMTDPTPNPQSVLDAIRINVKRESKTSLTLADFKLSNPELFTLPAGDVGVALGVEWREEDFDENRDDRSDGTIQFHDLVTGELINVSDMMGSSASPDADGSRRVTSAYAEFLVPLLRDLPGVHSLDMQLAGRYEHFSDVGDVAKPKVALSWYPSEWLQFRAAYSKGFRAPNLVQLHQGALSVVNNRTDPVTGASVGLEERRVGNKELEPEESENFTYGFVLTPEQVPGLVITADYWQIKQDGVVSVLGAVNGLNYDAVLRAQGSFNPNVIREVTTDGSIGEPILFLDKYQNLEPREIEGVDFSIAYSFDNGLGEFDLKWNGAYLISFDQELNEPLQAIQNSGGTVTNAGSLIKENGRPRWRSTASAVWRKDQWGAGVFVNYISDTVDTSTRADSDTASPGEPLPVDDYTTVSANVSYRFESGSLDNTTVRLGLNNMFDEEPDFADEGLGYQGSLHSNRGRYAYIDVSKKF